MEDFAEYPGAEASLAGEGFDTVLVVDDSRAQRRVLAACLMRWGFDVTEAESGDIALEMCRNRQFDLILSDWMMPGLSGPEFCAAFRALPQARYGYFILVTSRSDKVDIVAGLETGADDFLTKPVSTAELKARIRAGARLLRMEREMAAKTELLQSTLGQLQELYGELDRDLREARKLQQSLVRDRSRSYGASHVAMLLEPSGHVGGDLVGSFVVDESTIGIFTVDVAGHGVASALLTARISGLLSGSRPERNVALTLGADGAVCMHPPAKVCAILNKLMLEEIRTELYFTMALARIDLETGQLEMAFAGHPGPLIQAVDGSVAHIPAEGMPIGLIAEASFGETTLTLSPGERILLFSDGMSECENPQGVALEESGLAALLAVHAGKDGLQTLDALSAEIRAYSAASEMADDISALLFAYRNP